MSDKEREWIRLQTDTISPLTRKAVEFFEARIKGQPRVIRGLWEVLETWQAGMSDPKKPIASFLFCGPSGTGKTETARTMAEWLLGDPDALTIIPCANYSQSHEISALLGSPHGYVGYDDEPLLSQRRIELPAYTAIENQKAKEKEKYKPFDDEYNHLAHEWKKLIKLRSHFERSRKSDDPDWVKLEKTIQENIDKRNEIYPKTSYYTPPNPNSIILFDEIERGNKTLHDLLLNILDTGQLPMKDGEVTDFTKSFIFMTSNIGADKITSILRGENKIEIVPSRKNKAKLDQDIYEAVRKDMENFFGAPFLGRITKILLFRALDRKNWFEVLDLELQKLQKFLNTLKLPDYPDGLPIILELDQAVKDFIVDKASKYQELGVRRLQEEINHYFRNPLAALFNSFKIKPGNVIRARIEDQQGAKTIVLEKLVEESPGFDLIEFPK